MAELKRWIVLVLSGLIGLAAAVGYGAVTFPGMQEASRSMPKSEAEWVTMAAVMEVCVTLFSTMYFSGRLLALLFRSPELAAEIQRNGTWHTNLLGALLVLVTLQRLWFTRQGDWRRFDTVFAVVCMAFLIALVIVFKLGIGRGEVDQHAFPDEPPSEKSPPWRP